MLATVLALDAAPAPPEHGPDAYIAVGDSLVPGWVLSLLALALLLPAAVAAVDAVARAARAGERPRRAAVWVASLSLGLLAPLFTLYVLALIGVVERPRFPFDPGRFAIGITETLTMILLVSIALRVWHNLRVWRVPDGVGGGGAIPAAGCVAAGSVLVVWLANPYLLAAALLLVPLAHAWLAFAREPGRLARVVAVAALAAATIPFSAAVVHVASRLDLGLGALWQFLLMLGDQQVPALAAIGLCALGGSGLALLLSMGLREGTMRTSPVDASPIAPAPPGDDIAGG